MWKETREKEVQMEHLVNCVLQKQQLRWTRSLLQAVLQTEPISARPSPTFLQNQGIENNNDNKNNQKWSTAAFLSGTVDEEV